MTKTFYRVICTFDPQDFNNVDEAIEYAEKASMHEVYLDEDISIVKVEETIVKKFRNGGEVA